MDNTQSALMGAFIMEGIRDTGDYLTLLERWDRGCLELICDACSYSDLFDEADKKYNTGEDPGVYEYEVYNKFGNWFACYVVGRGYTPTTEDARQEIDRLHREFFEGAA